MVDPSNEALSFGKLGRVGLWCPWILYLIYLVFTTMHIIMILCGSIDWWKYICGKK